MKSKIQNFKEVMLVILSVAVLLLIVCFTLFTISKENVSRVDGTYSEKMVHNTKDSYGNTVSCNGMEVVQKIVNSNVNVHRVYWKCSSCNAEGSYSERHECGVVTGACNRCDYVCKHEYDPNTSTCSKCGTVCNAHNYDSTTGMCTICKKKCVHSYDSTTGKCLRCKYECSHPNYEDGVCMICDYECSHPEYENGVCKTCDYQCEHEAYTTTINSTEKAHNVIYTCNECEKELYNNTEDHYYTDGDQMFSNGICIGCKYECTHSEYEDGICTICEFECPHSKTLSFPEFNGSSSNHDRVEECTICKKELSKNKEEHYYTDYDEDGNKTESLGVCLGCGYECTHSYNSSTGICSICEYKCGHDYNGNIGICIKCGFKCSHDYYDSSTGKCKNCYYRCNHRYNIATGKCKRCDYELGLVIIPICVNNNEEYLGKIKFYHNDKEITNLNEKYLKFEEKIRAEVEIEKYLYTGIENGEEVKLADVLDKEGKVVTAISEENYPTLKIGDYYFEPVSVTQTSENALTVLVYEFTSTDIKQEEVLNPTIEIDFTKNKNNEDLYVYYSDDDSNFNTKDKINGKFSRNINMHIDGIPYVLATADVEDKTEFGRYRKGTEIFITAISSEKLKDSTIPEVQVGFSESGLGKYNYQKDANKGNAKLVNTKINEKGYTVWTYLYIVQAGDEGIINIKYVSGEIKDLAENIVNLTTLQSVNVETVYADTTAPTVNVTSENITNNATNLNTIKYILEFSEKVDGFTVEDITVNGGTKGKFEKVNDTKYTIEVETNVANGNEGKVQLIIENGVCKDVLSIPNVRVENIIKVDKKAPECIGVDVNATDKEMYKAEDEITIIAKFSENIEDTNEVPNLQLVYSESGAAKGELSEGTIVGNKIIWKYTISKQDEGILTIKRLNGAVIDLAGNSTSISKNELSGYGIIVDNTAPEATITYDKTEITNTDVIATITFNEDVETDADELIKVNNREYKYTFTENKEVTFEFVDLAGNTIKVEAKVENIDKVKPTISFQYNKLNLTEGEDIEVIIKSDENAKIKYWWEVKNNASSGASDLTSPNEEYVREVIAYQRSTQSGTYTLKVEATDLAGNKTELRVLTFKVNKEEVIVPEIVFKDLTTTQVDGENYVKVTLGMTKEEIISKMDTEELEGCTPTFTNLTSDGKVTTGTKIKLNGKTEYTVVAKGDINGDGKIDFMGDVLLANNYRIGIGELKIIEKLAADIDGNGEIDFMTDVLALNNYRLGIIKDL